VTIVDYVTQAMLTTLHIEELLRERQPRHEAGAPWYGGPSQATINQPAWPRAHLRLRRRLGALLIQAGRRLGDGTRPPGYPLYGSAHR
jgi:hypothetical protein